MGGTKGREAGPWALALWMGLCLQKVYVLTCQRGLSQVCARCYVGQQPPRLQQVLWSSVSRARAPSSQHLAPPQANHSSLTDPSPSPPSPLPPCPPPSTFALPPKTRSHTRPHCTPHSQQFYSFYRRDTGKRSPEGIAIHTYNMQMYGRAKYEMDRQKFNPVLDEATINCQKKLPWWS